ncbi:MAG TPA: hypothetical protein VG167_05020 [Verrucomicrobiae bacterium]|nr:hypothetical protein [Verrucomicrobiae bacterium]
MKSVFDYRELVRKSKEWLSDTSKDWMCNRPRRDLHHFLESAYPSGCGKAIGRILDLAVWGARNGCLMVAREDCGGWEELKRFFEYRVWVLRTQLRAVDLAKGKRPTADPTLAPFHLLGMALTFREPSVVRWLGEAILNSRTGQLLGYWIDVYLPFRLYICELHSRLTSVGTVSECFGPYKGIFSNWESSVALSVEIAKIADYHITRIDTGRDDEYGEFNFNPHDIFPTEILALYRVREKLGLETPLVQHPLLDTPFAQVPETIRYDPDPLVTEAMSLVEKLLPEAVSKP